MGEGGGGGERGWVRGEEVERGGGLGVNPWHCEGS